jgi:hypothetical protein|tara:strand:- start:226 stop:456 length:231 start_codon:yes stop_codon:yes gene_type:complete
MNDINYPELSDYDTRLHREYKHVAVWEKMKEKYGFTDKTPILSMAKSMSHNDWVTLHNAVKYRRFSQQRKKQHQRM